MYSYAQQSNWVRLMDDPEVNFYEVQEAFNTYWEGREIRRGCGWKPFRRWEYFMEPRVYPDGKRMDPSQAWRAHRQYMEEYSAPQSTLRGGSRATGGWRPLGPAGWNNGPSGYNPGNGRINVIAVHPGDDNIIYIGSPSGGIWKTTDGGNNWIPLADTLPVMGVSGIAIHPFNPDTLYIGTGDGFSTSTYSVGVLKSYDGGLSWDTTGLNWNVTQSVRFSRLLIHPYQPDTLLAATSNGIFRSANGGQSWSNVQNGNFKDLAFHPTNPEIVYAGSDRFYKSTDGGATFTQVTNGLPSSSDVVRMAIGVSPDAPDYVYVLAANSWDNGMEGLYRSTDGGNSFSQRADDRPNLLGYSTDGSSSGGQGWYDLAVTVSPSDADRVFVGGVNVWRSSDGGSNWSLIGYWYYPNPSYNYVHADIHTLDFFGNVLYAGTDGGLYVTNDEGSNWTDLSDGLEITQCYRFGNYAGDSILLYMGTQDNGSNKFDDDQWTHVFGADGMEAIVNYNNPSNAYTASQYGGIRRTDDGGASFTDVSPTSSGAWVTPYVMHPTNPDILFAGYQNVWKTTNQGNNWTQISDFSGITSLQILAVAPSNPDYIYAGTNTSLHRTTDGGTTWTSINSGLPTLYVSLTYLTVHPSNPEKLWVTCSGYSSTRKVYYSEDGGDNWTNYTGTLPNLPINCIEYQQGTPQGVYIGTDVGVYYRDTTLSDWVPFMDSLPNVIVRELEIHDPTQTIRAATYGRGVWESKLYGCDNISGKPAVHFSANKTEICAGQRVQFSDQSLHCPTGRVWNFPGGSPSSGTSHQLQVTYENPGTYDVSLTVTNADGDSTLQKVDMIEVLPLPATPNIYMSGDSLRTDSGADSLQWLYNGNPVDGANEAYYIPAYDGNYKVLAYHENGCKAGSQTYVLTHVPGRETSFLGIYPNPSGGTVHLNWKGLDAEQCKATVYHTSGKEVHRQVWPNNPGDNQQTLYLHDLPTGIYIIQLTFNQQTYAERIVIE